MCAFQIGLYALGLHNRVSPNWLSRTYSSHVSWIGGQAMEIGVSAISFLIGTWEGHLTPPEAASMADKASKTRDNAMVIDNYTTLLLHCAFFKFSFTILNDFRSEPPLNWHFPYFRMRQPSTRVKFKGEFNNAKRKVK